jgi:hypothetical protein
LIKDRQKGGREKGKRRRVKTEAEEKEEEEEKKSELVCSYSSVWLWRRLELCNVGIWRLKKGGPTEAATKASVWKGRTGPAWKG